MNDVELLGHDLAAALRRRHAGRRRRRRIASVGIAGALASAFSAIAIASAVGGDLQLDPTKWSIVGGGSVDGGGGEYVHAQRRADGSPSTFLVEYDDGLSPYDAFLLHEQTRAAADASSPVPVDGEEGERCTPEELTRAESVAIATLRSEFPAGTPADEARAAVDAAVQDAFAGATCRGLEYAGEQARLVHAGVMPETKLMPGAR